MCTFPRFLPPNQRRISGISKIDVVFSLTGVEHRTYISRMSVLVISGTTLDSDRHIGGRLFDSPRKFLYALS